MSRIALDGIMLADGAWPDPREADTDKTVDHYMLLLGETPEVTSVLRAFLAGG